MPVVNTLMPMWKCQGSMTDNVLGLGDGLEIENLSPGTIDN